ncbi:MAG: response regulator, partial [bacterium]|nr:response regulator [bacterium]
MAAEPAPKVLVIDDEPVIIEMIREMLELLGYTAIATTQWTEVIDAAEHEHPQLMLLDLNMPTIDGISLLRFLREQGHTFPVVVVSGYIDAEMRKRLIPFGVVAFVDKPFEVRILSKVVYAALASVAHPEIGCQTDGASPSGQDARDDSSEQVPGPQPEDPFDPQGATVPEVSRVNPGVLVPRKSSRHKRARDGPPSE